MREIEVQKLELGSRLPHPLYHEGGTLLLLPWHEVDVAFVTALARSGITFVFDCATIDELRTLRQNRLTEETLLSDLPLDVPTVKDHCSEEGQLVVSRGQILQQSQVDFLQRQGIRTIFSQDSIGADQVVKFQKQFTESMFAALRAAAVGEPDKLRVRAQGKPVKKIWSRKLPSDRTNNYMELAYNDYTRALEEMNTLFERLRQRGGLELGPVHRLVETFLEYIIQDRDLVLYMAGLHLHNDYIIDHSLHVGMISMVIGAAMGYGRSQLFDLGTAAFLHDIGMTRIPINILNKSSTLNEPERQEILSHTVYGIQLLSRTLGVDSHVFTAIYQSHERQGGQGYPRNRDAESIHDYAQIIAVADTYTAMTSPRVYRPSLASNAAMAELLSQVKKRTLSPSVVRSFLQVAGLFPVGSLVRLSDNRIGRVVSASEDAFSQPRVNIILDRNGKRLPQCGLVNLYQSDGLRIEEEVSADRYRLPADAGFHATAADSRSTEAHMESTQNNSGVIPKNMMDWSSSFTGKLEDFRIIEIMQLLNLSQKSGALKLQLDNSEGSIFFSEGEIISATLSGENKSLTNEDAIYDMIAATTGYFAFQQRRIPESRAVSSNTAGILMEGCRRLDESHVN